MKEDKRIISIVRELDIYIGSKQKQDIIKNQALVKELMLLLKIKSKREARK